MARWVEVPADVAARHPLHGMRGWLRFFSIWIALAAIGGVMLAVRDAGTLAGAAGGDAVAESLIGLVTTAVQLVVAVLWFRAWPRFRRFFAGLVVVATLVALAFDLWEWRALDGGSSDALAEQVATDLVGTAGMLVLLAYMQASRRFRVTFENRVRQDDWLLADLR
ncbi:hypothetical protein [Falsiroseomonas sp. HW251]|uniref:hypothetical protein n=1 Tax=Falsiroseomonas sp. HW251 TaxID=3390998 RepID=UPI003D31D324